MTVSRLLMAARAQQQPQWDSLDDLKHVLHRLENSPAPVDASVCTDLASELVRVARGEALVVQVGECAERFHDAVPERVLGKAAQLHNLADAYSAAADLPVIRIGRIGGQYAKPRSSATETLPDGTVLPVYRGDAVNSPDPTPEARRADATRLLHAYRHAVATLSILWERDMGLTGAAGPRGSRPILPTYAAHEALLLEFEQALVRPLPDGNGVYGSSSHYLWIGDRTRQLDYEHVQLASRLANPIGVKIGPNVSPAEVLQLVQTLSPEGQEGKLSVIVRMGAELVSDRLPSVLDALGSKARQIVWICDPMHGNTRVNGAGQKSRALSDITAEIEGFHAALSMRGLHMGGLMLEATDLPVTECVASREAMSSTAPLPRYESACDPRLDGEQARTVIEFAAGLK